MMAKGAPKKEAPEMSESEDAASDILAAFSSKDAKALDLALQRHYACCSGDEAEDDEMVGVADEDD